MNSTDVAWINKQIQTWIEDIPEKVLKELEGISINPEVGKIYKFKIVKSNISIIFDINK